MALEFHTTVGAMRELIACGNARHCVVAFLVEHNYLPGEAEIVVTPSEVHLVNDPRRTEAVKASAPPAGSEAALPVLKGAKA